MYKKLLFSIILNPLNSFTNLKNKVELFKKEPKYYFKEKLKIFKGLLTSVPKYPILKKINKKINFLFDFNLSPAIFKMYLEIFESDLIKILQKYVNEGDIFIDVGANIGYISAFAASLVGKSGEVHSFEPVPIYFNRLCKMVNLNKDFKIYTNNCALGESNEISNIYITNLSTIGWNTMVPNVMKADTIKEIIEIEVTRLDDYIFEKGIENVSFIKIDVEGYEYHVLRGLKNFFEKKKKELPPLVVEIEPDAYSKLNIRLKDLEILLNKYNYKPFSLIDEVPIKICNLTNTTNVFFKQI